MDGKDYMSNMYYTICLCNNYCYIEKGDYDIKDIDWLGYLKHFSYIASNLCNYRNQLNRALSQIDMELCDIMHYIELYNLNENESHSIIELLKECREKRRNIKDEMFKVECFRKAIGTKGNINRAKDSIKQIEKLSDRVYHPRKLKYLFENCTEKSNVKAEDEGGVKRIIKSAVNYITDKEQKECMKTECTEKGAEKMEYSKKLTVFDGKNNDWQKFIWQQIDFYDNVEQYIYNLQTDLNEIENEIENKLIEIESAGYSVLCGYKFFRSFKQMRNRRKNKLRELEYLKLIIRDLDCREMARIMHNCAEEIHS